MTQNTEVVWTYTCVKFSFHKDEDDIDHNDYDEEEEDDGGGDGDTVMILQPPSSFKVRILKKN
jgi:hypothetical protein